MPCVQMIRFFCFLASISKHSPRSIEYDSRLIFRYSALYSLSSYFIAVFSGFAFLVIFETTKFENEVYLVKSSNNGGDRFNGARKRTE